MIQLTRLNGQPLVLNSDLIKLLENAPDTVITLVNGEKIVVKETTNVILERVVEFRRRVLDGLKTSYRGWSGNQGEGADPVTQKTPSSEDV